MTAEEVADLIEAVAARDRGAFAHLFREFAPRIKAYGIRAGADATTAEELAQEAMISVWRGAASYDRRRAAGATWIFTIARNRRIDLWRRQTRPEIDPDDPMLVAAPPAPPDAAHEVERVGQALREAIAELPPDQAEILRKAYFEDKSQSAISDELGVPLGTIKSRARLGLARLRVLMAGFES